MSQPISVPMQQLLHNGTHLFATCWRITRTDGEIFRFTSHSKKITISTGEEFSPIAGVASSARQRQQNLRNLNLELQGVITSDQITDSDLRGGKFRDAKIEELVVNWKYPWQGTYSSVSYWIQDLAFDGETWIAQVTGNALFLRSAVGQIYTRNCRHRVGRSPICAQGVSLASITVSSTVSSVVNRQIFLCSGIAGMYPNNKFALGEAIWTSGNNVGVDCEVKRSVGATGRIVLQLDTPYDIQVGDTVDLVFGCDGTVRACKEDFNNFVNFGGWPDIPGTDKPFTTPDFV